MASRYRADVGRGGKKISIQRRVHLFERLYADLKANESYAKGGEISIAFMLGGPEDRVETNVDRQALRSYLLSFRQLISDSDPVFLPRILGALPRHVDDAALRERLARAHDAWKAAQGIPSMFAPMTLGPFASGRETARLYLYGGVFHSNPDLSGVWDAIGENRQKVVEHAFQMYESKVRLVIIELKLVIDAARDGGYLRDEPLDLADRPIDSEAPEPDNGDGGDPE